MLADGFSTRRGRQGAYLHRDAVNHRLRARRGARLTAITCGGAIPDNADYQVVLEPSGTFIGTLNEDFAVESLAGDVFQLGNCSYRILRVGVRPRARGRCSKGNLRRCRSGWAKRPARSAGCRRRWLGLALADFDAWRLPTITTPRPSSKLYRARFMSALIAWTQWLRRDSWSTIWPRGRPCSGDCRRSGGWCWSVFSTKPVDMHLVIHAPFGARINRAFGLALRKRFCRAFNFELQAAATEDAIVLSLGETHSFALEEVRALPQQPSRPQSRCWSRLCSMHRCSPPAGDGTRRFRWPSSARAPAKRLRHRCNAWRPKT